MGQISEAKAIQFWGDTRFNTEIEVLCHTLNGEKGIGRMIKSVLPLDPYKIRILIDSRTTDNVKEIAESFGTETEYFDWCNNFSYPKNILTQKVKKGNFCLMLSDNFQLQPHVIAEILEFVKDPYNIATKFQIPEFHEDSTAEVITRPRTLLWRSLPPVPVTDDIIKSIELGVGRPLTELEILLIGKIFGLYWQRLVHEEMHYSLYRIFQLGIPFTVAQALPLLGGTNGILHYGMNTETEETNWRKRSYYMVLYEIDKILNRSGFPEDYVKYFDVDKIVADYTKNGFPKGLEELYKKSEESISELEEESIR